MCKTNASNHTVCTVLAHSKLVSPSELSRQVSTPTRWIDRYHVRSRTNERRAQEEQLVNIARRAQRHDIGASLHMLDGSRGGPAGSSSPESVRLHLTTVFHTKLGRSPWGSWGCALMILIRNAAAHLCPLYPFFYPAHPASRSPSDRQPVRTPYRTVPPPPQPMSNY